MSEPTAAGALRAADDSYSDLERLIAARVGNAGGPLLVAASDGLFDHFLEALPEDRRQYYRCACCRRFVERYGGVVRVGDDGQLTTLLWESDGVPPAFAAAVGAVRRQLVAAEVTGVFLSGDAIWGRPTTGQWTHLSGTNSAVFKHALKTPRQMAAEKAEDYRTLRRGLADFPRLVVEQAVRVLDSEALYRSEKTLGVAKWLLGLHTAVAGLSGDRKDNVVWRAVAEAPPGFCHVRSTMISTLLDDLAAGVEFEAVQRRWAEKMHPLQYMRPTTVTAGAIERAEKIVAELNSAGALRRRFATLADVTPLWTPRADGSESAPAGVFGHLKKMVTATVALPPQVVTWEKFARTVLPDAGGLEVQVPHGNAPFFGLTTAADPGAPPLLQWDLEPRNPVSCYFYHGGSPATQWGLVAGEWSRVAAVFLNPAHWHHPDIFRHHTRMAMLALVGCRDLQHRAGGGFFAEQLRNEYHEIRSVMDNHAKAAEVVGRDAGDANGIAIQAGAAALVTLRVTTRLGTAVYVIDRLD
ncbi:MAG: hypothetical protein U0804_12580 [Gemmataceae bacterium]